MMKSTFKKQMFVQAKNPDVSSSTSRNRAPNPQSFIDPATYMRNGEFVFKIPPKAPVFEPTVEEFLDPLAYINKIRPIAEKHGICKVKPPPEWHPPFAVDVDHFKFTPRIQKLNELDANTRVKLYFLDRLATYWNYSGVQIRIPAIEDKTVDMYSLYKLVDLEGGFEKISADKRWSRIAQRMGYINDKVIAPLLKQHYKRLLLPFEKFEKSKMTLEQHQQLPSSSSSPSPYSQQSPEVDGDKKPLSGAVSVKKEPNVTPEKVAVKMENGSSPEMMKGCSGGRRCTRSNCDDNTTEILVSDTFKNPIIADKNKELQRLTFYGPGPKILGSKPAKPNQAFSKKQENAAAGISEVDLLADSACMVCGKGDSEENILLCDGCDDGYHTFCLAPPLSSVPKGEWRCPKCIAVVVSKASDTTFGFEQAEREYSLQQFGEMADQFKSNYFNMPVHMVPTEKVEHEYWKILSSMDSSVTVEYGADLHSMDHGSGFPTQLALKQSGDEYYKSYVESSWNLNNIPVLEGSVLGYINADISGMKVPWMYVGMCFSTFCWHNEDHWSYSINYLHWGEPKTWYGVPGFMAEKFEQVMQETTPDLFRNQPDLLHQLVTILNPNILMDRGVPVYHIDQAAGEFVLTFPRAYHAGFNHGYNFAEAVNFAPVDWIPLGRECVEHYSGLHRYCVFSHDELICKMASVPENLNSKLASATHQDMLKMLDAENKQRKALLEWGVVNAEREAFELLADDERKCAECNTTCFLSAVTCKCSPKRVTCLRHFKQHCPCAALEHTLRYRYTLDELPVMLEKLKEKADSVAVWAAKVHDALNINTPRTITLSGLKELLNEAREKHFPDDLSLSLLSKAIKAVQDALAVDFKNILSHKQTLSKKVTLTEIRSYYEELQRIPCILPQENIVKHFLKFLEEFEIEVNQLVKNSAATLNEVEHLLKKGQFPNVDIPCLERLESHRELLLLVESYREMRDSSPPTLTLELIEKLAAKCKSMQQNHSEVAAIGKELSTLKDNIMAWEKGVESCFTSSSKPAFARFEKLLEECKSLKAVPPCKERLTTIARKVTSWRDRAEHLLSPVAPKTKPPFIEQVERLIEEGVKLEVEVDEMPKLRSMVAKVSSWRQEVHEIFLGDCQSFALLEVLLPRRNLQRTCKYKKNADDMKATQSPDYLDFLKSIDSNWRENLDEETLVSSFNVFEKREFELMRALRVKNTYKKKQRDGTFCICNSSSTVLMKECTLCKDLFHEQCLKLLANYWEDRKADTRIFLCPFCQRTKRPSVKGVVNALVKLEKLQIRTLEGTALRCLLDREAKWKEWVHELLKSPELALLITTEQKKNCKTGARTLGTENRNKLESLLFRGFILELDIPENEIIYKILHKLDANNDSSSFPSSKANFDQSVVDMELSNETFSLENELSTSLPLPCGKEKRRRYSSYVSENNENDEGQALRCQLDKSINSTTSTTTTITTTTKLKKDSNSPSAGRNLMHKRKKISATSLPRMLHHSPVIESKTKVSLIAQVGISPLVQATNSSEKETLKDSNNVVEEEEETECEAKQCLKPTGEHVDWVQCDYCKNWLHMICIGVTKGEVDDQTEFMCSLCKSEDLQRTKDDETEDDDDDIMILDEYSTKNTAICS